KVAGWGTAVDSRDEWGRIPGKRKARRAPGPGGFRRRSPRLGHVRRRGRLTSCAVAHATWNTLAATGIWLWY
ncbi:MAG TPA: hypothetical protein VLA33_03720, partial [Gemmatimonadota bacterium]|nr:hypothetical protein [Gemmatimonadota bacterium]